MKRMVKMLSLEGWESGDFGVGGEGLGRAGVGCGGLGE